MKSGEECYSELNPHKGAHLKILSDCCVTIYKEISTIYHHFESKTQDNKQQVPLIDLHLMTDILQLLKIPFHRTKMETGLTC